MAKKKLERVEVPRAAFDLARERTSGLIGELAFYHARGQYIEPGDALGDVLACAYLQGVNDTAAVIARKPGILR